MHIEIGPVSRVVQIGRMACGQRSRNGSAIFIRSSRFAWSCVDTSIAMRPSFQDILDPVCRLTKAPYRDASTVDVNTSVDFL